MRRPGIYYPDETSIIVVTDRGTIDIHHTISGKTAVSLAVSGDTALSVILSETEFDAIAEWIRSNRG